MSVERFRFSDIFLPNSDGSLAVQVEINVNGFIALPGTILKPGEPFGGVDFVAFKDYDVAGEYVGESLFFRGFFRKGI